MNRYGRDYENRSGWMHGGSGNAGDRMNHNPGWEGSGHQGGGYDYRGGYQGGRGGNWDDSWDARDNNRSGYGAYTGNGGYGRNDYNWNDSGYDYGESGNNAGRGWGGGQQQGGGYRGGWSRGQGMDYDVDYSGRGNWQQQGGNMGRGGMNRGGMGQGGGYGGGYGMGGGVNGYRGSGISNLGDRPGNSHFFGYGATFPRGYSPGW